MHVCVDSMHTLYAYLVFEFKLRVYNSQCTGGSGAYVCYYVVASRKLTPPEYQGSGT